MAKKLICDICDKEIKTKEVITSLGGVFTQKTLPLVLTMQDETLDICHYCAKNMKKWVKRRRGK